MVTYLQPYLQHFPVFAEKWIIKKAKIFATALIGVWTELAAIMRRQNVFYKLSRGCDIILG